MSRFATVVRCSFVFMLLGVILGCRRDPAAILVDHAPGLEREFARHLVHDDDSTFVQFVRSAGWPRTYFAQQRLLPRDVESREAYEKAEAPLLRHQIRLARAIGIAYDMQQYADTLVGRLGAPVAERFAYRQRIARIHGLADRAGLSLDERSRRIIELADGCGPCTEPALFELASVALQEDRGGSAASRFGRLLALQRRSGNWNGVCRASGQLAAVLFELRQPDSAVRLIETGVQVAEAHRLNDQVARLRLFLGNHYASEGRWAVAHDQLDQVRKLASTPLLEGDDVRFVYESLEFPMRMGWWDLVERDLRATSSSLHRARRSGSPWVSLWEGALIEAEALVAAHARKARKAELLFARADAVWATGDTLRIPRRGRMLASWARVVLDAGRPRDAARIADKGLRYCRSSGIHEFVSTNALVLARAHLARHDLSGCDSALQVFERAAPERNRSRLEEWIEYEALRARWHHARGDERAMVTSIRSGLDSLESRIATMDPNPETYTFLAGENDLHELLHEVVRDPDRSLEIEHRWRNAVTLVREDSSNGALTACADQIADSGSRALPASRTAVDDGTVEIVYHVGRRIVRWTRTASGTRRDELATSPGELERRVARAMEAMGTEPAHPDRMARSLESALRDLCRDLLPQDLEATNIRGRPWLRIQADGILGSFPFEALNASRTGYRPLQEDWNISYARGISTTGPVARLGTIVADPTLSSSLLRKHGGLAPLTHARMEARAMAAADPTARRLFGASATKRALEHVMSDSRYLFLAVHAVHEAEVVSPFFIPLAPDSLDPRPDSEYLEMADVLGANFSGCELVVLSGCATGIPVGLASSGTPSLASAFIDAGAGAVICTLWPVRDDEAAATMSTFIDLWKRRGMTPELALNEVRRRRMKGPRGYRHPFTWGAYRIEMADVPAAPTSSLARVP